MPQKKRTTTLQEKFGFMDSDLKTPQHDAIMTWLDGEVENIAKSLTINKINVTQEFIDQKRKEADEYVRSHFTNKEWHGLGEPPKPTFLGVQKKWERPVFSSSNFIAGFIDMEVILTYQELTIAYSDDSWARELPQWTCWKEERILLFEVKSKIQSIGDLIRQIRLYQAYKKGTYFVVSPDDQFEKILLDQGIRFIKVPHSV